MTTPEKPSSPPRKPGRSSGRVTAVWAYLMLRKGKRYLPTGVRALAGLILILLGLLGFLPVLGFWMIPLGLGLLATDVPPLGRWLKRKLNTLRKRRLDHSRRA